MSYVVETDVQTDAEKYARYAAANLDGAEPRDQQAIEWAKALALTSIALSLLEMNHGREVSR